MKLKNCLHPSKMQIHLLSIPCRLHVLAGAHAICQGHTAAQGQRSDCFLTEGKLKFKYRFSAFVTLAV